MKLYISGHNKDEAAAVAALCAEAGHEVTARWLLRDYRRTEEYTEQERADIATSNAADIAGSDALVLLSSPRRVPGGKFVEAGIALGQGKLVFVLGHRENMICWHPQTMRFNSAEDLLAYLAGSG